MNKRKKKRVATRFLKVFVNQKIYFLLQIVYHEKTIKVSSRG